MPRRIVVSFRGHPSSASPQTQRMVPAHALPLLQPASGEDGFLDRAMSLKRRADAHGAVLCAWSAWTFSFALDADELEEALALASLAREGTPEELFGAGVAEGELATVGEVGLFAQLGWGQPLLAAVALAEDATAGEVRIAPSMLRQRAREIEALGWNTRGERVRSVPPEASPSARKMPPPRVVDITTTAAMSPIFSGPYDPSAPVSKRGAVAEAPPMSTKAWRTIGSPPVPSFGADALPPLAPERVAEPRREPERRRAARTIPPAAPGSVEERLVAEAPVDRARQAMLEGNLEVLEPLLEQLHRAGEHADLVARMMGFMAIRRGTTADALRILRSGLESAKEPARQVRARLAYAVGLSASGRLEDALLEALGALARARATADAPGERACTLFLSRLSASAGHADAASAWSVVGMRPAAG